MSDLEWYLEIGGKQSGPHAAKEIVDLVRAGRIPANAQVTAARMSGDWVTAKDLVDAYDELYQKTAVPKPNVSEATVILNTVAPVAVGDPNFQAPPRPTEQLEATKNIFLNRTDLDNTPDPTEALFQAIQAVREKATNSTSGSTGIIQRPSSNQMVRGSRPRIPPQAILVLTLAAIFGVTLYGITMLLGNKKTEIEVKKTPVAEKNKRSPVEEAPPAATAGSKLLGDDGRGVITPRRTAPALTRQANPAPMPPPMHRGGFPSRMGGRPEKGGGARYREDHDPDVRIDDEADVDETEPSTTLEGPAGAPMPVDPSQVPLDKIIPEQGLMPGNEPSQ